MNQPQQHPAGLDLGSRQTRLVICTLENGQLRFLGAGEAASQGWSKGRIADQRAVSESVISALREVEARIAWLQASLGERKQITTRVDGLADYLRCLASHLPVNLPPLQALADAILAEAKTGQPLRFHYASPVDPSRFAAAPRIARHLTLQLHPGLDPQSIE